MKETQRSLKLYFGLGAAFALLTGTVNLVRNLNSVGVVGVSLISIAFGLFYVYIIVRMRQLLLTQPQFITIVLTANLAFGLVIDVLSQLQGINPVFLGQMAFSVLIYAYLVWNLKRLAADEQAKASQSSSS